MNYKDVTIGIVTFKSEKVIFKNFLNIINLLLKNEKKI